MNFLSYLYRRSWPRLLAAVLASVAAGASGVALIGMITKNVPGTAGQLAALFFGVCALQLLTRTVSQVLLLNLTQGSILDMRLDMSRKLLAARLQLLNQQGKSELLTILTRDVESLIAAMTIIPMVMTHTAVLLGCLAYMAWLGWELFLVFLTTLGIGAFTYHWFKRHTLRQLVALREEMGQVYGHFHDLIEGRRELQLNVKRGQMFISDVLGPDAVKLKRSYVTTYSRLALITNFGDILFYLVIGGLLFVAPQFFSYDTSVLTAFAMIVLYLTAPLSTAMNAIPVITEGVIAFRQIGKLDAMLTDDWQPDATRANPFANGAPFSLALNEVRHHYLGDSADDRFLLGPLNLNIGHGEILFIIGGNGSGKTTLAMLLLGLYLPERGKLSLNGVAVNEQNAVHYRSHFSAVFADFHLFRHLLLEPSEDSSAQAAHYLNKLGLGKKVQIVDGMFSTLKLSSGQRKRLALISAYLEDRPVYLFDEWAADQDPVFKRVFYHELLPELRARGKTVIVISHDDAYFSQADRIIRLQDGKLITQVVNESHENCM